MFPNVNGFSWTPLHITFLLIFFSVTAAMAVSVAMAAWRAHRDLKRGSATKIAWRSVFEDLPPRDRACRHQYTGEFQDRCCDRAFDCRGCTTHAKLVRNRPVATGECENECYGLRYPSDRFYHRGHTWVRPESDGTATIGPDDLSRRMFGAFQQLELPACGTKLEANGVAWTIRQRGDEFRVLSPMDGEVVEQGGPDDEFFLRVRPDGGGLETTHLLRGAEIQPWVKRELERLQILVALDWQVPSLADGGVLVDDAPSSVPEANWPAVWGEMLLEP